MSGGARGIHLSGGTHGGLRRGRGSTQCYIKQPHLTDEMIMPGWGRGAAAAEVGRAKGRKSSTKGEGPGPRYCALSAPTSTPTTSPPLHSTGALAFHPSLPPPVRRPADPLCSEPLAPPGKLGLCNVPLGGFLVAQW